MTTPGTFMYSEFNVCCDAKSVKENKRTYNSTQYKHVYSNTWEAAKHGVSVVSSIEHL